MIVNDWAIFLRQLIDLQPGEIFLFNDILKDATPMKSFYSIYVYILYTL